MPTVNNLAYKTTVHGHPQQTLRDYRESVASPRVKGVLKLQANPHTRIQSRLITDTKNGKDIRSHPWGGGMLIPSCYPVNWDQLEMRSYASFRRKLYEGSASLGVTLASYKQSREMIVKRFNQLKLYTNAALGRTIVQEALRGGRALKPKDIASLHLEVIFGWMPLVSDIHAAATTVIQSAPVSVWVKSRAKSNQQYSKFANGVATGNAATTIGTFEVSHSRGAMVSVANPNVWLAERAGLLNPASVAWDVVPWSFVVNMFVNTGQLVNSLTDFSGLTISNGWATKKARGTASWSIAPIIEYPEYYSGRSMYYTCNEKYTTKSAISVPNLQFKVPKADFSLAAMAASLFLVKFSKLAGLINPNHRTGGR